MSASPQPSAGYVFPAPALGRPDLRVNPASDASLVARRGDCHQTRRLSPMLGSRAGGPPQGRHRRSIKGKAKQMKALVYHGPGQRGWDTVADPTIIDPTDAVVRIDSSTI